MQPEPELTLALEAQLGSTLQSPNVEASIRIEMMAPGLPGLPPSLLRLPALTITDASSASPPSGTVDLELGELVGAGGMGAVFRAQQTALMRSVAVKCPKKGADPRAAAQLIREATITGALEHPNVIPVHALGRDGQGQPLLIMKLVEGVSWKDLLREEDHAAWRTPRRDRFEWNLRVLLQVAQAAHFAHSRGYIHRDLKPENVMIGSFGEVYVMDWGIAVPVGPEPIGDLGVVGTPAYMAPEMVRRDTKRVSVRTDVYLLGAILHELLTGRPPHSRDSILLSLFAAAHSKPFEYKTSIPGPLAEIAKRAMKVDPEDRQPSAEAFRAELEMYLQKRSSRALSSEAHQRRMELESLAAAPPGASDPAALYKVFGECRFGFQQALSTDPDNAEALSGLTRAITRMAEIEIHNGNPKAALTMLAELKEPDLGLLDRARALEASQGRVVSELQTLRREIDISVGSRARAWFSVAVLALFTLSALLFTLYAPPVLLADQSTLYFRLILLAIVLFAGFFARGALITNTASRRQAMAAVITAGGLVLHSLVAKVGQTPIEEIFPVDLLLLALSVAIAAVTLHRPLILPVPWLLGWSFFLAERGPTLRPRESALAYGSAIFGSIVLLVVIWVLQRERTTPND